MTGKKGFALFFAIVIMSILTMVMSSLFAVTSSDLSLANATISAIRAYYIAEAGLAKKYTELCDGIEFGAWGTILFEAGQEGSFSVGVNILPGGDYELTSIGLYNNVSKTISVTLRPASSARYSHLTNMENSNTQFLADTLISGPFHTNSSLYIRGSPVFEGPVSSVGSEIIYYHGGPPIDNPQFMSPPELGAPWISLPMGGDVIPIRTAAQDIMTGGLYLPGSATILLLPDGTMEVTNAELGWNNFVVPLPANGALFVEGALTISGTLKGRVTIGAPAIYITGNIRYSDDPRINPDSTDMLGLVADSSVFVDSSYIGPHDFYIDAYIIAVYGSLSNNKISETPCGTLFIYGGVIQNMDGQIGLPDDSGNTISGYKRHCYHDTRMQELTPPYFPPLRSPDGRKLFVKTQWSEL